MANTVRRTLDPQHSATRRKVASGKQPDVPEKTMTMALAGSNSLVDLAARIVAEHTAIHGLLSESVQRAMAAGDLLLEAKALVKHGQGGNANVAWQKRSTTRSGEGRTARPLHAGWRKNRGPPEIEKAAQKRPKQVADLTLSEAKKKGGGKKEKGKGGGEKKKKKTGRQMASMLFVPNKRERSCSKQEVDHARGGGWDEKRRTKSKRGEEAG